MASDYPVLNAGDSGTNVEYLQRVYGQIFGGSMTIPPDVTGVFDDETTEFTKLFQRRSDLKDDGIVGPKTWRQLEEASGGPLFATDEYHTTETLREGDVGQYPTLREGADGDWVTYLQQLLAGQLDGPVRVTGHFGSDTDDAVRTFQAGVHIYVDGIVGEDTWTKLHDYTERASPPAVEIEGDVVTVSRPEPPTYPESEAGKDMLLPRVRAAVADAQWFASKYNEWATYNGSAEGRDQFIGTVIGGFSFLDGGWVLGFLKEMAASTQAGEIAVLNAEFDSAFADGFIAGLTHVDRGVEKNPFLEIFSQQAYAVASRYPTEQAAWILAYLIRMGDASFVLTEAHPRTSLEEWQLALGRSGASTGLRQVIENQR